MNFNSYIFILVFLPLSLLGYYLIPWKNKNNRKIFLLLISIGFYSTAGIKSVIVILLSIFLNYLLISKHCNKIAIVFDICLLVFFKYINSFLNLFDITSSIFYPLAISFIIFSEIAFAIENLRNNIESFDLIDYSVYILYFPKLIEGPITNPVDFKNELIKTEKKDSVDWEFLYSGFILFLIGLCKKVLLADVFGICASYGYEHLSSLNSTSLIITVLSYTIQIYFDFSGYSDMAIGISEMFGIQLPINFNSPYKALNISDFWNRWHITLTKFLTKYLYIPLGGNRKGKFREYLNVLIVFAISGLWHGNGTNYLLWGLFNGIALVIYKIFKKQIDSFPKIVNYLIMFIFINVSWIIFRTNNIEEIVLIIQGIFKFDFGVISSRLIQSFFITSLNTSFDSILHADFWIYVYFIIAFIIIYFAKNSTQLEKKITGNKFYLIILLLLSIYSILNLSRITTYIYQFY